MYWDLFSGGRVLQIPRAKVEDAGRYMCVAVNEAGEDSLQYDVRVLCEFVCFFFVYDAFFHSKVFWGTNVCMMSHSAF